MPDRADIELGGLLHAAMTLVAADGLKGLSLRPLAERLGTTVSALTHRFGLKDQLLGALVDAAAAQEGAFLDRWRARIQALDVGDPTLMADLADAILADLAGPEALRTRFYCELLQGVVSRPEIAPALSAWSARRLAFWRAATAGLGDPELGGWLNAFSTIEGAHGLSLGEMAAYRWLRRLNLRRLCCGLIPADGAAELWQFQVFRAALGDQLDDPTRPPPALTEWQAKTAGHISRLIIAEGADAVTHRAIAARAGVANSTLAYHFPRQEDLLQAGLRDIATRIHGVISPTPGEASPDFELTSVEIARATFAVALSTARMPSLLTFSADLRRRRGENYVVYLNSQLPGDAPFDVLSAQAMSLTGQGQLVLDAILDPTPDDPAFRLIERLKAIALARR